MEPAMSANEIHDQKQDALRAFLRDLPQLWAEHPGMWVAYQGSRQLGLRTQKHELYQECHQRGLQADDFVIFCIEPQETEIASAPSCWIDERDRPCRFSSIAFRFTAGPI